MDEPELAVLNENAREPGLEAWNPGAVVLVHGEGEGYDVEFAAMAGAIAAVVSLLPHEARPVRRVPMEPA